MIFMSDFWGAAAREKPHAVRNHTFVGRGFCAHDDTGNGISVAAPVGKGNALHTSNIGAAQRGKHHRVLSALQNIMAGFFLNPASGNQGGFHIGGWVQLQLFHDFDLRRGLVEAKHPNIPGAARPRRITACQVDRSAQALAVILVMDHFGAKLHTHSLFVPVDDSQRMSACSGGGELVAGFDLKVGLGVFGDSDLLDNGLITDVENETTAVIVVMRLAIVPGFCGEVPVRLPIASAMRNKHAKIFQIGILRDKVASLGFATPLLEQHQFLDISKMSESCVGLQTLGQQIVKMLRTQLPAQWLLKPPSLVAQHS